jgi:hypothetical protein
MAARTGKKERRVNKITGDKKDIATDTTEI